MPIFDTTPSGGETSGVSSFNGRTGAVMPQDGDYTAAQVNARPDNWMPTAGDGVNVTGETVSVRVSQEADNATGILNGALYTSIPRPSAVYPLVEVKTIPATPSIQVTATKGELTVQGTTDENGIAEINVTALGVWTFTATISGEHASADLAVNTSQLYALNLSIGNILGVSWDKTNPSTQLTRLTPTTDPNGFVTIAITSEPQPAVGAGAGSSPFDNYMPWSGMEEYNIIDGLVSYKKGDPGFSRTEHDTMVFLPKFYYRVIDTETIRYFYVADKQITGFDIHPGSNTYVGRYNTISGYYSKSGVAPLVRVSRASVRTSSRAKGTGWDGYDYMTWCAVWLLYLVEFADWNSQSVIGDGITSANAAQNNGATDSMLYHTGRASGTSNLSAVQFRWIENPFGNVFDWIDGVNFNEHFAYLCTDPANYDDDTEKNYTNTGVAIPVDGFISGAGLSSTFPWAFLPSADGGSASTYIPDYTNSDNNWSALAVGGSWSRGWQAGFFCFVANFVATDENQGIGARLLFRSQEVTV